MLSPCINAADAKVDSVNFYEWEDPCYRLDFQDSNLGNCFFPVIE